MTEETTDSESENKKKDTDSEKAEAAPEQDGSDGQQEILEEIPEEALEEIPKDNNDNSTDTNTDPNADTDAEPKTEETRQNGKDTKLDEAAPAKKMIGRCFEITTADDDAADSTKVEKDVDIHYYIELLDDGSVALEKVGEHSEPTGELIEGLSVDDFSSRFKTCSQHECPLRISTLDEIEKKMAENRSKMGEEHLKNGELDQAKDKFKRALKFDEDNIRAKFGLGKTCLKEGNREEAEKIFLELSTTEALFEQENKHVFNKFGIELRRSEMYDLAIANYEKAILIDSKDEALYYNLSVAYEKKELIQKAIEKLKEALELESDFPEAKKRLELLLSKEKESLDSLLKKPT